MEGREAKWKHASKQERQSAGKKGQMEEWEKGALDRWKDEWKHEQENEGRRGQMNERMNGRMK